MEYDYVALIDQPRHGPYWKELVDQGWCEWMKIPFWAPTRQCGPKPSYVYVMRRPKDEPRMWTESELKTFVRKIFDEDSVLRGGSDENCPQCGKWLDPAMSCCPHCLATT